MNTASELLQPLPDVIEPNWWNGTPALPPASFTIDCSHYSMDDADLDVTGKLATEMKQRFHDIGLVYLVNTGLSDLQRMRQFARLVVEQEMVYEGGANPRDSIEPNVYEVGAPLGAWLHYHHEMAYVGSSTKMLGFLAHHTLADRGWTFVSDNLKATDDILATEFGQKLKEKGLCYHRNLTDRVAFEGRQEIGVYNHWQKSMLTEDPGEAEEIAASRGLKFSWGPDRLLKTRYYISAFEYFQPLDRNLLYSSVADHGMWFDKWPLVMHLPYEDRPLNLTFGDDTPMSREELQLFVDIYDNYGTPIKWQQGDVAIICNYRFAHGRPEIVLNDNEQRELGVIVGDSFDRVGDVDGKW